MFSPPGFQDVPRTVPTFANLTSTADFLAVMHEIHHCGEGLFGLLETMCFAAESLASNTMIMTTTRRIESNGYNNGKTSATHDEDNKG